MFLVYSQNQNERKSLQEQYLFKDNSFVIPFQKTHILNQLINKVFYQFQAKNESIFLEKLKKILTNLINLDFSFSSLRDLLEMIKQKDYITNKYRQQILLMDQFFNDNKNQNSPYHQDIQLLDSGKDSLQEAMNYHQLLQITDFDSFGIVSAQNLSNLEKNIKQKIEIKHNLQSFKCDLTKDSIKSSSKIDPLKSPSKQTHFRSISQFFTPGKILVDSFNNIKSIQSQCQKYLESFTKKRSSILSEMMDKSLTKLIQNQKLNQVHKRTLQQEMSQQTRTLKSIQYNKNIKNVIFHRKLKERKKQHKIKAQNIENQQRIIRRVRSGQLKYHYYH